MRSHSMETMVSSQKKQHSGGIPGSLSGGISHNSMEVTKTTFSVSAAGPGAARSSWGGPPQACKGGSVCPGLVQESRAGTGEIEAVWG